MNITLKKLIELIPTATMVLVAIPENSDHSATEIWIKFRHIGRYVVIDFEQPFPKRFEFHKLVGAGNALNCTESKKDELYHYGVKREIIKILQGSIDYKSNMNETIYKVIELLNNAENNIQ